MNYSFSLYLILGAATFIFVGALTPVMRKVAVRINAFDAPNMERKVQKEPVPYLGGVAISIGVVLASFGALLASDFTSKNFALACYVLIPAIAISTMGLIDDLKGLQPWPRLIAQTATGLVVAAILIATNTLGTAFDSNFLNIAISVLWIVGVTNSINFFDNLDGGAAGTVAVISTFIFLIAFDQGQLMVSALAIVTAGATSGFLLWNKSPAKIYMGDAGALFLGVIVAVLTIRLDPGIKPELKSFAIPLLLMAVPILDTTVAVVSRLYRGISPFQGGRDHLSHRLMRRGLDRRIAAIALWALAALYGAFALTLYRSPDSLGYPVIAIAGVIWAGLLGFFLSIPSSDSPSK